MMPVNVSISAEILDWVIAHTRLDRLPEQIAEYLRLWSSGEKVPTFNQVEKTSRATGIPLGYFFLKTPPHEDLSLVEYRTVNSSALEDPSRNLIDTMHDMEMVQDWMRNHLISDGADQLQFVGAQKDERNKKSFAAFVRKTLSLSEDWYLRSKSAEDSFGIIRKAISNAGVIVMMSGMVGNNTHRTLDINEFRAFAVIDDFAPLIFINSNDFHNAKLFSLLHEFAHICVGEDSLFNDRYSSGTDVSDTEIICNAVAAEVLVPQEKFISEWSSARKAMDADVAIQTLSRYFKCGSTVIARKALESNFIDHQQYEETAQLAIKQYTEFRKKQKEAGSGGDYYNTAASRIDQRFFGMLLGSVATGRTLYSDAFRLTNTNRSTFANLAEKAGGSM